jgi:hypothetical protein
MLSNKGNCVNCMCICNYVYNKLISINTSHSVIKIYHLFLLHLYFVSLSVIKGTFSAISLPFAMYHRLNL